MKNFAYLLILFGFLPTYSFSQDSLAVEIENYFDQLVGIWKADGQNIDIKKSNLPPGVKFLGFNLEVTKHDIGVGLMIKGSAKVEMQGQEMEIRNDFFVLCACNVPTHTISGKAYDSDQILSELNGKVDNSHLYIATTSAATYPAASVFDTYEIKDDGNTLIVHQILVDNGSVIREFTTKYTRVK